MSLSVSLWKGSQKRKGRSANLIEPYFETPNGKLYHGDCLDIMKELPDESVDLVLTDPPYGVRKKEDWDDRDYFLTNLNKWLDECLRVTKSTVIWFCSDQMLPYILKNREDVFHRPLIWNKPSGSQFAGAQHNNLWYSSELILVFTKNFEITKQKGKSSKFGYSVFEERTVPMCEFGHPTTKPLNLMKDLIYHYSDVVEGGGRFDS